VRQAIKEIIMDVDRFDRWTRTLVPTTRRVAVWALASGLVATVSHRNPVGAGGCRKHKEKCSHKNPCCTAVGFNLQCKSGKCHCKPNFKNCDEHAGTCDSNLRSDPNHCGKCGIACGNGESCLHGACTCAGGFFGNCPAGCGSCALRKQGGDPVCFAGSDLEAPCDTDAECPLGTGCLVNGFCGVACFG
jgi:hypothetical protein